MFTNKSLAKVRRIMARSEGGIHKRIDENRELLELLQKQAPNVLVRNPWVEGWFRAQDNFLNDLASAVTVDDPKFKPRNGFPRSWPYIADVEQPNTAMVDIRAYAEAAHRHANTALWGRVLDAFQTAAADRGYGFTRAPQETTQIDTVDMRAIGKAVIKARLSFIAPRADTEFLADRAFLEDEDLAWVESIVKALNSQGVYVRREAMVVRFAEPEAVTS